MGSTDWLSLGRHRPGQPVRLVRGHQAVAALQPAVEGLSRRTGQTGSMDWLGDFLLSPDSIKKIPYMLLMGRAAWNSMPLEAIAARDLDAALLIYEYRYAGLQTGIFATDDTNGSRTVIAPSDERIAAAHLAATELMRLGAAMAFISVDGGGDESIQDGPLTTSGIQVTSRSRAVPAHLPLASTLEETLGTLGTRTRRNLRYYRRRAEREIGAAFVPRVRISREEFLALNTACTHPLTPASALWRHRLLQRSAENSSTVFAGLRSNDGSWLSLIWGHRHNGLTKIEWQMNRAGLARHSISTVMRSFLLEHEIGTGATQLRFIGGTPHSIQSALADSVATDILAVRSNSLRAKILDRFARRLLPESNFLRSALSGQDLFEAAQ
jgi:hypothetical protein